MNHFKFVVPAACLIIAFSGCGKKAEEQSPAPAQVESMPAAIEEPAAGAGPATASETPALSEAATLLQKVRELLDNESYEEAKEILAKVGQLSMTPEEKRDFDEMNTFIQNVPKAAPTPENPGM